MPNRFLVPALITGMILTVRITPISQVHQFEYCIRRVLATPFGPNTR
jgi:hypothetical protein